MIRIICLDGVDGCGKTTLAKELVNYFKEINKKVYYFHEPGSTEFGNKIYSLFKESKDYFASEDTKMLLVNVSRIELFNFIHSLDKNENVFIILDRYIPSTLVYQGFNCKNFTLNDIYDISLKSARDIIPEYSFLIDIPIDICLSRLRNDNKDLDITEEKFIKITKYYKYIFNYLKDKNWNIYMIYYERALQDILDILQTV